MDNVTHSLTGFFLSRAGFNRLTPNAAAILILSANAPDIDILALAGGTLNYFHFHRHFTHSLIFAPVLAVVAVALVRALGAKRLPWGPAILVALCGVASHLLLDLTNAYGIRLLLPFSSQWLRLDLTNIYDLWIWSIFALCLIASFLSQLVGGEIGAKPRTRYPGRGFAWFALGLLLLYDGARWILHSRAIAMLDSRQYALRQDDSGQYQDSPPLRVAAFPGTSNPLHWKGVAETTNAYHLFDMDVDGAFDPTRGQVAFKTDPSAAIEAAGRTEPFRIFRDFAQFPLWRTTPAEDGMRVVLTDIRFSFFCEAKLDRTGKIEGSFFSHGR